MIAVLHSPSHFPSSPNTPSDALFRSQTRPYNQNPNSSSVEELRVGDSISSGGRGGSEERAELKRREKQREELSFLALLIAVCRKSLIACSIDRKDQLSAAMDIGWPTNVRHVAHVTFDRFDGFLGLPDEFEPDVPRRAPSASTSVFGVSTESMQLSFDSRGNCVPTILILMQRRLYAQGGLQVEGIFRITADNSQEEFVRDQLNGGIIPDDIDVHCLAGLIKAWFRELPTGVLDPLSPDDVMRCDCEEDCTELVRQLPATEAALLDWAINLMADVVQEEQYNKMNAHNIAMVFAPNMTQMVDPLTALMYAVRVMNFLKTLITKRLRDGEDSRVDTPHAYCVGPSDESSHQSPSQPCLEDYLGEDTDGTESTEPEPYSSDDEPAVNSPHDTKQYSDGDESVDSPFHWQSFKELENSFLTRSTSWFYPNDGNAKNDKPSSSCDRKDPNPMNLNRSQPWEPTVTEKPKRTSNLSRISSRIERIEAWR